MAKTPKAGGTGSPYDDELRRVGGHRRRTPQISSETHVAIARALEEGPAALEKALDEYLRRHPVESVYSAEFRDDIITLPWNRESVAAAPLRAGLALATLWTEGPDRRLPSGRWTLGVIAAAELANRRPEDMEALYVAVVSEPKLSWAVLEPVRALPWSSPPSRPALTLVPDLGKTYGTLLEQLETIGWTALHLMSLQALVAKKRGHALPWTNYHDALVDAGLIAFLTSPSFTWARSRTRELARWTEELQRGAKTVRRKKPSKAEIAAATKDGFLARDPAIADGFLPPQRIPTLRTIAAEMVVLANEQLNDSRRSAGKAFPVGKGLAYEMHGETRREVSQRVATLLGPIYGVPFGWKDVEDCTRARGRRSR